MEKKQNNEIDEKLLKEGIIAGGALTGLSGLGYAGSKYLQKYGKRGDYSYLSKHDKALLAATLLSAGGTGVLAYKHYKDKKKKEK